jgi:hypothetical protein
MASFWTPSHRAIQLLQLPIQGRHISISVPRRWFPYNRRPSRRSRSSRRSWKEKTTYPHTESPSKIVQGHPRARVSGVIHPLWYPLRSNPLPPILPLAREVLALGSYKGWCVSERRSREGAGLQFRGYGWAGGRGFLLNSLVVHHFFLVRQDI